MKQKIRKPRLILWAAKGMFKSASKLKAALIPETQREVLVVRSDSPRFKHRLSDVIVNWGNSKTARWGYNKAKAPLHWFRGINIINNPDQVSIAVNKLKTFQELSGKCNIPEWTKDPNQAEDWAHQGLTILCRKTLTGFGGKGIIIWEPGDDAVPITPLYVQYKKKKKEFRVHVFNGEVIDITQKKKRKDFDGEINTKIRNFGNGWIYCREDIEEPDDLREQSIKAVQALGLDFGAVDIIWNEKENKSYILEINTAPGLEGTTIEVYKNAILKSLSDWQEVEV